MRLAGQCALVAASVALIAFTATASGQSKKKKQQEPQAAPAGPIDKRDRVVAMPGSPFHGREYWRAAAQCGGIYFKLNITYADAAIRAKVVKPDPAAFALNTKEADRTSKAATAFFDVAERFLVGDRKIARDEAVLTYDAVSTASGERVKTIEAGWQAAKPCPELYKICRDNFPQTCNDPTAVTAGVLRPALGFPDRAFLGHLDHAVAAFALGDRQAVSDAP